MSSIRRRSPSAAPTETSYPLPSYDESKLSAPALLAASPIHSGHAYKLHMPAMYSFLPPSVQWMISRCCPCWSPRWKKRYLIALGSYLYRFKDESGKTTKGAPIPMDTMEARIFTTDDMNSEFSFGLPPDCQVVIELTSVGKTQYFAIQSKEEATTWINTLRQMRQDCITRGMGHAKEIPYPQEWSVFDASARRLREQKARIRERMERIDRREMEMQSLAGGGMSVGGVYT